MLYALLVFLEFCCWRSVILRDMIAVDLMGAIGLWGRCGNYV